jgi:hypothetical protein
MRTDWGQRLRQTTGVLVEAGEDGMVCPICGGATRVQKTRVRGGVSLAHGRVRIRETVRVCIAGCGRSRADLPLSAVFAARTSVAYDVMVRVGLERFVANRQRGEIRSSLADEGVELSEAEISVLGRRFLDYFEALHTARAPELRAALRSDGGWPMHLDATGEDGRGTLLVVYAGWRGWVLGAWKIPTERADAISPKLGQMADRFGSPCAIMRDLGRAVSEAAATFVAARKLRIPVLGCHMHFLRDIGIDLMRPTHDELRSSFRHFKVVAKLCAMARAFGRRLGAGLPQARKDLQLWQRQRDQDHRLPNGSAGLATVRALAQWVLDFPRDGLDQGFPFDVPQLDLYDRCLDVLAALNAFLRCPPSDAKVRRACEQLHRILQPVDSDVPFDRLARTLRARRSLFHELRNALRLGLKPAHLSGKVVPCGQDAAELEQIRAAVQQLTQSLRQRRPARGPAQDARRAIDLVLSHLDRHGHSLWGHEVRLPTGATRRVARTNNALEGFFRTLKHGERRRSGRAVLTQDLEQLPPAAALALNLTHPDYIQILCGSLDNLPIAFAKLDADGQHPNANSVPCSHETVSRSLPIADRDIVRTDEMFLRINAAANSCAPR